MNRSDPNRTRKLKFTCPSCNKEVFNLGKDELFYCQDCTTDIQNKLLKKKKEKLIKSISIATVAILIVLVIFLIFMKTV